MSARRTAAILGLALAAIAPCAFSQDGAALPAALTLPALLDLVAERSPRLAIERAGVDAAEADRVTAGALPNPTLSYGRSRPAGGANTVFEGSRQQQAGLDLPLLVAGQRGARLEAAEQGVLGARARAGLARSDLALRAAELFAGLQAAQERAEALATAHGEIERAAALVAGRLESGMASRYDLARVEIEVAGMAARLADARADAAEKAAGIATLLGAPGWRPRAEGALVPAGMQADLERLRGALAAANPQIVLARREEDAARAAVRRAELERWPVPVLSVGRTWTSEPFGAANFIGLSTEVPVFDSRQGPLARAQAELRGAERRREAIEAEAGVELQRLVEALRERREALQRFERQVDLRSPALRRMAEDAYRLGRSSVLELIDAARTRADAQVTAIDLRALAVQQELRILALTGALSS